jgi:hypothetical protein
MYGVVGFQFTPGGDFRVRAREMDCVPTSGASAWGDGVEELARCRINYVVEKGVPPWCSLDTLGGGVDGYFSLTVCDVAHPIQATGGQIVTEHLEDVGW